MGSAEVDLDALVDDELDFFGPRLVGVLLDRVDVEANLGCLDVCDRKALVDDHVMRCGKGALRD